MKINRSLILLLVVFLNCINSFSQYTNKKCEDSSLIFNYFTSQNDSIIFEIGSVYLMSLDSLSITQHNIYCVKVDTIMNIIEIYFKNKLFFRYETINRKVDGIGYCFYPFTGTIAIQGQFKKGKLNGLVFVQTDKGEMIECMKFKKGNYKRHLFHFDSDNSNKSLKKISKHRSNNPLKNNEIIVR